MPPVDAFHPSPPHAHPRPRAGESPCRNFVAHRHCQSVLDAYFAGDYRDSKLCIPPDASVGAIMREILIQLLHVVLLGKWEPPTEGLLATIVRVPDRGSSVHASRRASRQRKQSAGGGDPTAGGGGDAPACAAPSGGAAEALADSSESEWDADFFDVRGDEHEHAARAHSKRYFFGHQSSGSLLGLLRLEEDQILSTVRRWQHFVDIPKVRLRAVIEDL